jgi:rhodanese-related sulfurtransferase
MIEEISADGLQALLDEDEPVRIVDIRAPGAFSRGHIPGSECTPFARLTQEIDAFDDDTHVVTVCPHGQASKQAARLIDSYEGFSGTVQSLKAGYQGWEQEYEVRSDMDDRAGSDRPF